MKKKTVLLDFETDIFNKKYTRCSKGIIIGSRHCCRGCKHFVAKIFDSIQGVSPITGKQYSIDLAKGIVECSNV